MALPNFWDILLIVLVPLILFLVIALIVWWLIPPATTPVVPLVPPFSPTGITGNTGTTGFTGDINRIIQDNMDIVSIDPNNVLDITWVACGKHHEGPIVALTYGQQIAVTDGNRKYSQNAGWNFSRIVGFNRSLVAIDDNGKAWASAVDRDMQFHPIDHVNKHGTVSWINTTLQQDYLWVTYTQDTNDCGSRSGILFDCNLKIVHTTDLPEERIYGTSTKEYLVYDSRSKTLRLQSGQIWSGVLSAVLNWQDAAQTIPTSDAPPLRALRMVGTRIYTLLFPNTSTSQVMAPETVFADIVPANMNGMNVMMVDPEARVATMSPVDDYTQDDTQDDTRGYTQ